MTCEYPCTMQRSYSHNTVHALLTTGSPQELLAVLGVSTSASRELISTKGTGACQDDGKRHDEYVREHGNGLHDEVKSVWQVIEWGEGNKRRAGKENVSRRLCSSLVLLSNTLSPSLTEGVSGTKDVMSRRQSTHTRLSQTAHARSSMSRKEFSPTIPRTSTSAFV